MTSKSKVAVGRHPIFGMLSVAAPFIGGVLAFLLIWQTKSFLWVLFTMVFMIPLSLICGMILAVVAWIRRERYRWLAWIGLPLNSAVLILAIFAIAGIGHPGAGRIKHTKMHYKASELRATLLPLFANYHYDRTAAPWGPPNYIALNPVPKEVAALPLFSNLGAQQEVLMGALEDDTNAFIIFTESGMSKWGIVLHRSEDTRELPLESGQRFTFWDHGVFFYEGSNFPD